MLKYIYDAWGNCVIDASTTNTTLANLNPFRYRSYYFDTESGFYFLMQKTTQGDLVMIYLNKKQFLPAMILISIMFVPIMLMLTCLCLFYNVFQPFLIIGILLVTYLLLIFCFFKISKSTKNYLIINNDGLDICCRNKYCDKNTGVWKVPYNEIARIDYYRISSLKGWVSLWTGLLPKCVFITIQNRGGKENSVFIGYLDLDQVKLIASTGNIEIFVH